MSSLADFTYKIGRYWFQYSHNLAQTPLAGGRFLVLVRDWRSQDVYGEDISVAIFTWRVEELDRETGTVGYELETKIWFCTPEEAIADFEAAYFTEVIQEYPI